MAIAVVTVAAGGIAVVDVTATSKVGMAVTEAVAGSNGIKYGIPVTKVTAPAPGIPVVYVTGPP